jgi:protein-L-isoaspartate(D-aspartate) O-methyltransferase
MDYPNARAQMVRSQLIARGIKDERVIQAMNTVPRHLFVEEALRSRAYSDRSLPIGEKQTISQPYIVARMSEALDVGPQDRILEVGTGSGYQTAILSYIGAHVYSLERLPRLLLRARRILDSLGRQNVSLLQSDGSKGWREHAPFDAVLVAAGSPSIPEPLLEQLAEGGRLVLPIGDDSCQELVKVVRRGDEFLKSLLGECRFVKLVGNHGWNE